MTFSALYTSVLERRTITSLIIPLHLNERYCGEGYMRTFNGVTYLTWLGEGRTTNRAHRVTPSRTRSFLLAPGLKCRPEVWSFSSLRNVL